MLTACSHLWFSHFIIGERIQREKQWEFLLEMFSVQNIFITFSLLPQFLPDPPHPSNFMLSLSKSKKKNPKTPKQTENWKCKQRRKTEKLGSTVLRITPRLQHGLSHQQEENTERFWSEILVAYFFWFRYVSSKGQMLHCEPVVLGGSYGTLKSLGLMETPGLLGVCPWKKCWEPDSLPSSLLPISIR